MGLLLIQKRSLTYLEVGEEVVFVCVCARARVRTCARVRLYVCVRACLCR